MTEPNEKSVFLAALELNDGAERAAYLNKACGGDSLFRKRIEALLVEHERSGQFLSIPVLEQLAAEQDSSESELTITTHGQSAPAEPVDFSFLEPSDHPDSMGKLGHYEIREMIGRGGCGIVLRAFDTKLERIVAIKVMYPELAATSPARKRFLREARATAAIRHKNVVSIYAVEENPLPYLVMELIDGPTLQQKINAIGPLELVDTLEIGQQAAAGLAAAHAKGLIHRDIKPANILLEGNTNEVKLTDFGLARSADDASITQSGIISGTPLFMSPEQAQGLEMDERSDLFSLGSVLYMMSSGRPPFRAKTTLAVLRRVVEDQPRPIQQIIPEVPQWLTTIIDVLLAKEPERRFSTADEVASLLQHCYDSFRRNENVQLPPELVQKSKSTDTQAPSQAKRASRRHIALSAAFASLAALALIIFWFNSSSSSKLASQSLVPQALPNAKAVGSVSVPQEIPKFETSSSEIEVSSTPEPSIDQPAYTDRSSQRIGEGIWVNDGDEFFQAQPEFSELHFGDTSWTDYDVHVEMKTESDDPESQGGSLYLRAQDPWNRYSFTPGNYSGNATDLAYVLKNQFGRDDTYAGIKFERNRWYEIDAKVRQDTIEVSLDGEKLFETKNPYFSHGRIGLGTWNSIVRWRNLTVTDPNGKLLWKGFPEGDTKTISDLDNIATAKWQPLLRSEEEFERVVAASPPAAEADDAYAKYIDGQTELHAENLYFTDIIAKDAIIRAKIQKLEGSWGGLLLRSNHRHIAVYAADRQHFHVWLHDGKTHIRLADIHLEEEEDEFFELALATIGKTISVYVNGKRVFEREDKRITELPGMPALRASAAAPRSTFQFKDVEVMVLDPPVSPEKKEQLTAMQWACRNGARMNGYVNQKYFEFNSDLLPITVPAHGLTDFDMRTMSGMTLESVDQLAQLPSIHRIFNAPPGVDDAFLLKLLRTPGINYAPHFDIRDSKVTDAFFEHLKEMPNLYGVCLNNTQISSAGLKHLLKLNNKGVMVENCKNIDDEACELLASKPRWLWLTLAGTAITDRGLEKLSVCSQLDSVDVRNCHVTEAAIRKLSDARPALKIIWDGGEIGPKSKNSANFKNSYGMQFSLIPHGKAWLGGGNGKVGTEEVVFTEDFYLGSTEVTQAQWETVMGRNPSYFQASNPPEGSNSPGAEAVKDLTREQRTKLPVELVSWDDVQQFLEKLNAQTNDQDWIYRLPTEAEWEYACRNGPMKTQVESAFDYYFGKGTSHLDLHQANIGNRLGRTEVVASYTPNHLGLYDMHGNLYEWCHDTVTDENGEIRHPVRGGGFFLGPDQNTATQRNLDPPDFRNYLSGFRVARVRKTSSEESAKDK